MYFMNLFSKYWACLEKISRLLSGMTNSGRYTRFFAVIDPFSGSFMYIKYIKLTMRRVFNLILMLDVPYVHGCIYVMYKRFSKSVHFFVLRLSSWMYMRSTSMYIGSEIGGCDG